MEAGKEVGEVLRPDGDHGRETDGGIHRVPTTHPIPEPEHIDGVDTEFRDLFSICRDRDEVLGNSLHVATQPCKRPVTGGVRIGHGLKRGEGL